MNKYQERHEGLEPCDCLPTRVKLGGKFYPKREDMVRRYMRVGKKTKSFLSELVGVGSFLFREL